MNKANILKQFNPDLNKDSLDLIRDFDKVETKTKEQATYIQSINDLLIYQNNKLKNRINDIQLKVNTALFGNRKFLNESYAYMIPLKPEYFISPENASFKDGILTTGLKVNNSNNIPLNASYITSKRNTDFSYNNKTLEIEKNEYENYQELEINIPKTVISGFLHLEFNRYDNISILDTHGKEIVSKTITNTINHPISNTTKSIILRFHNNIKKELKIINFYISQVSFNTNGEIYTKPIAIYQNLKEIGINTCDNYSDDNIDINYEVSINGGLFRPIRPLNKQKNLHLNSILAVDDIYTEYKLSKYVVTPTGLELYRLDDFNDLVFNIRKAFKYKLGDNIGLITNNLIYINLIEDTDIILNKGNKISINDIPYEIKDNIQTISLKKGFNKLLVDNNIWNQKENILNIEILAVSETELKIKDKTTGEILTKVIDYNTNDKDKNSLFYQLINKGEIFLEELELEQYFLNNKLYITRPTQNDAYVFIKHTYNFVSTIQLKINLKTLDKNNPVYISSLTVRGV